MYTTNTLTVKTESAPKNKTDYLTEVLTEATYEEIIKSARVTYVELAVEKNFRMDWEVLVNIYKHVWSQYRDLDFSGFAIPDAPELPQDDLDGWIEQMESHYGDIMDWQTAVRMGFSCS